MINCKNCGAPLTKNRCEYCGTVYSQYATRELEDELQMELRRLSLEFSICQQMNEIKRKLDNKQEKNKRR